MCNRSTNYFISYCQRVVLTHTKTGIIKLFSKDFVISFIFKQVCRGSEPLEGPFLFLNVWFSFICNNQFYIQIGHSCVLCSPYDICICNGFSMHIHILHTSCEHNYNFDLGLFGYKIVFFKTNWTIGPSTVQRSRTPKKTCATKNVPQKKKSGRAGEINRLYFYLALCQMCQILCMVKIFMVTMVAHEFHKVKINIWLSSTPPAQHLHFRVK